MSQPMTPNPTPNKKMSPWAWVAIGCGAIVIIAMIAMGGLAFLGGRFIKKQADKMEKNPTIAAAEWIVRANPELEVVESDADAGTLTIKNTKTGEVVTMNAKDIEEGKLTFTTKDGTTTIDGSANGEEGGTLKVTNEKGEEAVFTAGANVPKNLPAWLPVYAGATVEGAYDATSAGSRNATFTMKTSDSIDQVAEFYEAKLKSAGLKVDRSSYESNGQKAITLVGTSEDGKKTATIGITNADGTTRAAVNFAEQQ